MANNEIKIYPSKIIKAGALLADTKTLLVHWDETLSVAENLKLAQEENIFGKSSRSWISQFLGIFKQRYLTDEATVKSLVTLVKGGFPAESLDRVLYFYATQSDLLLHDVVTEVLLAFREEGRIEILPADIRAALEAWIDEGKTNGRWSENTITRATRSVMATLRDFGVLQGASKKQLAPFFLPMEAFAYLALVLQQDQPSGERLINHPEWQLFFLSPAAVEQLFAEANQHHLLEYHAAGSIIRITFPTGSIEEYAHVILQRPA